ncbi:hypothetical protein ACFWPX_29950 [Nocardia sp. NPDC058518]|uniref:hypothetical protein n=1 Tax=Nocardia sp. NPDC058518 TaxID=3346534 RepID=UPI003669A285
MMKSTIDLLTTLAQDAGITIVTVAPPNSDKFTKLLGVGLWFAVLACIGFGIYSGVQLAKSFAEGTQTSSGKMAPIGAAIGGIISTTAASWVTFF